MGTICKRAYFEESPYRLSVNNTYDAASRQLTTAVKAFGIEGTTTGKSTGCWLIEDGIVAFADDGRWHNQ